MMEDCKSQNIIVLHTSKGYIPILLAQVRSQKMWGEIKFLTIVLGIAKDFGAEVHSCIVASKSSLDEAKKNCPASASQFEEVSIRRDLLEHRHNPWLDALAGLKKLERKGLVELKVNSAQFLDSYRVHCLIIA